jgi:hypothetical protein
MFLRAGVCVCIKLEMYDVKLVLSVRFADRGAGASESLIG